MKKYRQLRGKYWQSVDINLMPGYHIEIPSGKAEYQYLWKRQPGLYTRQLKSSNKIYTVG